MPQSDDAKHKHILFMLRTGTGQCTQCLRSVSDEQQRLLESTPAEMLYVASDDFGIVKGTYEMRTETKVARSICAISHVILGLY